LLKGLTELQVKYPKLMHSARGKGTFVSFDAADGKMRDTILNELRNKGVQLGYCGDTTIRFRPALIFEPVHAEICLNTIDEVMKNI